MARPFIMVAPTGARRSKHDHPALPVTMDEIAQTAVACHDAGADGFHLHGRDAAGAHSIDPGLFREAIAAITARAPTLAVQITTEAAGIFDVAAQLRCIETLRPAWASVSVREMTRDPDRAARLYAAAAEADTRIQHILYDAADAAQLTRWQGDGTVRPAQTGVILVLGRYDTGPASEPAQIAPFLAMLSPRPDWMLCAFSRAEHACLAQAATLGGTLRVGFENSIVAPDGTAWRDNAASLAALIEILPTVDAPDDARMHTGSTKPRG